MPDTNTLHVHVQVQIFYHEDGQECVVHEHEASVSMTCDGSDIPTLGTLVGETEVVARMLATNAYCAVREDIESATMATIEEADQAVNDAHKRLVDAQAQLQAVRAHQGRPTVDRS
jgi:hypothetical protein